MFSAPRPDDLDGGWTKDERIWQLMRVHMLTSIDELADQDGTVALKAGGRVS